MLPATPASPNHHTYHQRDRVFLNPFYFSATKIIVANMYLQILQFYTSLLCKQQARNYRRMDNKSIPVGVG